MTTCYFFPTLALIWTALYVCRWISSYWDPPKISAQGYTEDQIKCFIRQLQRQKLSPGYTEARIKCILRSLKSQQIQK